MGDKMALHGLRYTRSRLQGKIAVLETKNVFFKNAIDANNAKIAKYQQQIEELGETAQLVFDIALEVPVARRTHHNSKKFSRGTYTRFLLEALRLAKGKPLTSSDFTEMFMRSRKLTLSDEEYKYLYLRVRKAVQQLALKKAVARVSRLPGSSGEVTWRLPDFVD